MTVFAFKSPNRKMVTADPKRYNGKPFFTGTDVLVEDVLFHSREEAQRNYPQLTEQQLDFVFDNFLTE